ncbi:MAG TPA: fatty acid desaturase family protein [Bryobacteraceae bacterium]|nr:fatty acid desaturase family protein [Bryobacteraceae bacterium]
MLRSIPNHGRETDWSGASAPLPNLLNALRTNAHPIELSGRPLWPALAAIAFDWAIIALAIAAMRMVPWWAHSVFLLIVASRQHALLVLMHDASHFLLCKNKRLNEILSDFFCAFPFGLATRDYRVNHLAHHEHLNTPRDPDLVRKVGPEGEPSEWLFPLPIHRLALLLFQDIMGKGLLYMVKNLRKLSQKAKNAPRVRAEYPWPKSVRLTYMILLAGLLALSGHAGFILYAWLVPLILILPAVLRLRSVAEHFALPKNHVLNQSRSFNASWWEAFLLAPHHVGMHLDHHLFPYVPWYRLPELHRRLLATEEYRAHAHVNEGYIVGENSVMADVATIVDDPRRNL